MKIKLEVQENGLWYELPPVGGRPGSRHEAKWLDHRGGGKFQVIVYSEDDLSIDDDDKKHRRLTVHLDDGP